MANLANGEQKVTLSKDTAALCGTKHRVKANITGTNVGDQINIKYKLESTSGYFKTKYHTDDGYLHKIRITIKNGNETVYQQDFTGDDSGEYISAPPFLINKAGRWNLYAKSIAAGDCAKPEGDIYFAYFNAKEPKQEGQEETEEKPINPDDFTPLLSVGLIGLAGLAFAKILRGKRSKKAETFEAPKRKPNYQRVMDAITNALYKPDSEEYKILKSQEGFPSILAIWKVYCYVKWKEMMDNGDLDYQKGNQIPAEIENKEMFYRLDWVKWNQNKMPMSIMNEKQFLLGFGKAREKYGFTKKQEGFLPIRSHWLTYEGKIFYYISANQDRKHINLGTEIYSIYDKEGREAFNKLTNFQKKGLLKDNEEIFNRIKNAETFEAPRRLNYKNMIYEAFYGDENNPVRKYVRGTIGVDKNPFIPLNLIWGADKSISNDYDMSRKAKAGIKNFVEKITGGKTNINCFYLKGKLFLLTTNGLNDKIITSMDEAKPFIIPKIENSDISIAEKKLLISLLDKNKYDLFAKILIQRKVSIKLSYDTNLEHMLRGIPKYDKSWLETQNPNQLKAILKARGLSTSGTRQNYIDRILNSQ